MVAPINREVEEGVRQRPKDTKKHFECHRLADRGIAEGNDNRKKVREMSQDRNIYTK